MLPQATARELYFLTDSSLKRGPWSWSRCEREAELQHTGSDQESLLCGGTARLIGMTSDTAVAVCRKMC